MQEQREVTILNAIQQEVGSLSRMLRNKMKENFIDWGIEITTVTCKDIKICIDILEKEILKKLVGGDRP